LGNNNPEAPAAAVNIVPEAKFGDPEGTRASGPKFHDEKAEAAEEAAEKKPIRKDDPISGALDATMFGQSYSGSGWLYPRTRRTFSVWRFYMHQKVAIDKPATKAEMEGDIPLKREVLHSFGIAYVVVAPNEGLTQEELLKRVAEERKALEGKGDN